MRIQRTYWIEPNVDSKLIGRIQQYGQVKLGKDANVNPPTISRWLHCGIGMREDWYKRIIKMISQVRCTKEPRDIEKMSESFQTVKRKVVGVE